MKGNIYGILGNLYLIKCDRERAIKCYEKAINSNCNNPLAIYNYGLVLLQDGDFDKALDLFFLSNKLNSEKLNKKIFSPNAKNRALLLEKNIPLAISSCYWRLNQINKAIDTLEELRQKYSYISPNTLTTLGYFYLLNKDYEKAEEISRLAINDEPKFASAWDNLGQIYLEQNIIDKAKEYFLKSIEYNPKSVDSLYHLACIEENSDINLSKEYLKRALECNITSLNTVSRDEIEGMLNRLNTKNLES